MLGECIAKLMWGTRDEYLSSIQGIVLYLRVLYTKSLMPSNIPCYLDY
jgi:hypothetical protein